MHVIGGEPPPLPRNTPCSWKSPSSQREAQPCETRQRSIRTRTPLDSPATTPAHPVTRNTPPKYHRRGGKEARG
ncbi:unnamed protein product [Arctogadus glacialis]